MARRPHAFDIVDPATDESVRERFLDMDAEPNASVRAIELAGEAGIDLSEIEGSGADGKVTVPDVRAAIDAQVTGEESAE